MKIYVIVDCCSGEDYSPDDPTVLFVTKDAEKAKQFFEDEIENWEGDLTDFDSNVSKCEDGLLYMCYECIDYEGDSHRILKLTEQYIDE